MADGVCREVTRMRKRQLAYLSDRFRRRLRIIRRRRHAHRLVPKPLRQRQRHPSLVSFRSPAQLPRPPTRHRPRLLRPRNPDAASATSSSASSSSARWATRAGSTTRSSATTSTTSSPSTSPSAKTPSPTSRSASSGGASTRDRSRAGRCGRRRRAS